MNMRRYILNLRSIFWFMVCFPYSAVHLTQIAYLEDYERDMFIWSKVRKVTTECSLSLSGKEITCTIRVLHPSSTQSNYEKGPGSLIGSSNILCCLFAISTRWVIYTRVLIKCPIPHMSFITGSTQSHRLMF